MNHLIKKWEGCKLRAYKCSAGVWTIGYGNTRYEDGSTVKEGDVITQDRADALFILILRQFETGVRRLLRRPLNKNQFDSVVSFAYNVGLGSPATARMPASGLAGSTLLRKINANPNDPSIRDEFMKWNKAGGKVVQGLTNRRKAEADNYFTPIQ